jgi:CDP-4-dehydro-6-deoxyglucose reductase
MPTKWFEGNVIEIKALSPLVSLFTLQILNGESLDFVPGQFITFDLPIGEKRLHRWRSYSISNAPDNKGILELCIVKAFKGLASTYLFEEVSIGTILKFKGPDGTFILPTDYSESSFVMICTGTGIAPFMSMIRSMLQKKKYPKHLHIIFGARQECDILYQDELNNLKKVYSWFHYDVALSKSDHWQGYKGYVHQIYLDLYKNAPSDTHFYICGWTKMIDEAIENLLINMKKNKDKIHVELYG